MMIMGLWASVATAAALILGALRHADANDYLNGFNAGLQSAVVALKYLNKRRLSTSVAIRAIEEGVR